MERERGEAMTETETQLLENALDALDRLYDSQSSVTDVHALLFATAWAMKGTRFFDPLHDAAKSIAPLRALPHEPARDRALVLTDDLRILLAENTPHPLDER
jgi:hypothetical protein